MDASNHSLSHLAQEARKNDPDRFLAAMFAPAAVREALFALINLNAELAQIPETVSEPLLGQIRLQWWRETLTAMGEGPRWQSHEVLVPLQAAAQRHQLSSALLVAMVDARERDLDEAPFESMAELELYAESAGAPLLRLWRHLLGLPEDPYAVQVGGAYALVGLLRALPYYQGRGRLYLPQDLLLKHGLLRSEVLADRQRELLKPALAEVGAVAARRLKGQRGPWAALARLYLKQLKQSGWDVYDARHHIRHPLAPLMLLLDRLCGGR